MNSFRSAVGSVEYAHARLCARYGRRPDEIDWRHIEHVRELPAMLDAARASPLRAWTSGIGPLSTPHEIDRVLREHWRALVSEVAAWLPEAWQPATRWCAVLVDLPMVQHLARGGAAMSWMRDDAILRELWKQEADGVANAPANGGLAPLAAAWSDPDRLDDAWLAEWRRRLPRGGGDAMLLAELVRTLTSHFKAFHDSAVTDGWPLRRALQARLCILFRRATLDPAAAFIVLSLTALDLERLRGELQRRAAFVGAPVIAEAAA